MLSITKEKGLLEIESLDDVKNYKILDIVLNAWALGIREVGSNLFKLHIESLKEKEILKIKKYYKAIELFTAMINDFISEIAINDIFSLYEMETNYSYKYIQSEEDLNKQGEFIFNRNFSVNKENIKELLEFLVYISLVKRFFSNKNITIFQTKKSEIEKDLFLKIQRWNISEELKKWCRIIFTENEKLEEFLYKLTELKEKEIDEINMKFETAQKLIRRLQEK